MPWRRSKIKRLNQSKKNHRRNVAAKRKLKTLTKQLLELIKGNKVPEAKDFLKKITRAYATTAKRGIIHRNNASRHISRLTKKVNASAQTSAQSPSAT